MLVEVNPMAKGGSDRLLDLEHRSQRLLSRGAFLRRWALFACIALGLIAGSLALGMFGYRFFEGMSWIDAFLNASIFPSVPAQIPPGPGSRDLTHESGRSFCLCVGQGI
jgi:hypothetical protein